MKAGRVNQSSVSLTCRASWSVCQAGADRHRCSFRSERSDSRPDNTLADKLTLAYRIIKKLQSARSPTAQKTRPTSTSYHACPYADAVDSPGQLFSAS
jgi:hypothetical protein